MSIARQMMMAAAGGAGGEVEGWNLATATYDSVSFSVAGQDGNPRAISFKPDGTKMYVAGASNDNLYQYTLSTAWDLSTASYDSVSFSVGSQDSQPYGISFKPDGTKMYMVGVFSGAAHQYTLSTAWDLSTASYDSVSFSFTGQEALPRAISFKPDGTKLYMIGSDSDAAYQYSLSTAWDLSTASYDSVSFSVAAFDTQPLELTFKPDGTKLYTLGSSPRSVFQTTLSTAWDLSTASYDSVSFSFTGQDTGATGLTFKPDGTKMYMSGIANDSVYQYSLTD